MPRITTRALQAMKRKGELIPMTTAYDFLSAKLADRAGIPAILVGDSLGMTVLGHETTHPVTMADMIRATQAVSRGSRTALIIADMPFMSYQINGPKAIANAGLLIKEGMAQAVKIEGGAVIAPLVRSLVQAGVPVMGHIGLTPQSLFQLGGYRIQGKTEEAAEALQSDALALQESGVFALVIELTPPEVAGEISRTLSVPCIGIGAGQETDGQIQVFTDLLGMDPDFSPRHATKYASLSSIIEEALRSYANDVRLNATVD